VSGVSYIDKVTRQERTVNARVVVLAASACESARLLLNSNHLANSSGVVGRNLTDTVGLSVRGQIPALEGLMHHDTDGIRGMHTYIPWWLFGKKLDFPRGYHVEMGGGFSQPHLGTFQSTVNRHQSYGAALKKQIRHDYGTYIGFTGRGEMIPNEKSYCEIDPSVTDEYGIPVLRFHFQWSDHELRQAEHMRRTFTDIITTLGGRPETISSGTITTGGEVIHEVGTIRMGDDPRKSALNKYQQAHEVPNLFVADAAPFVSNPDKNPTLSIVALAMRMSEYLAGEMRKGNV
jgi:choline dehydrogenase-like flavoprotein